MTNPLLLIVLVAFGCVALDVKVHANTAVSDSSRVNRKALYKTIAFESAYYAGAMAVLQHTWYSDKKSVPFHFYNDNKGYLQVDKLGHAFGSYIESYIGYHYFLKAGMTKKQALIYGASLGLILQAPIEIMDGIHEGWGFSWGDMAANAFGSALVAGQELLFNEQLVKYKFSYSESVYSRNSNNYYGKTQLNRLLKDYNGHTYWLSMPINRLVKNKKLPAWLSVSAGYSANGMYGEYENISEFEGVTIPETERYRQYLLSLDIDWTRIKTNSKFLKMVFQGLTFIKLPFPALECNSRGNLKAYWLYF
jgi:uncharacterized protein YfiM (DUF2279 family)